MKRKNKRLISRANFDGVIFDLDGVVTNTASAHFAAWKKTFDEFLQHRNRGSPFSMQDYLLYVDGKSRFEGVKSFLRSRRIKLLEGKTSDNGISTMHALANLKTRRFDKHLKKNGVEVYSSTVSLIKSLKKYGLKVAIISASKHCSMILKVAGLSGIFEAKVDGVVAEKLGIKSKPAPDIFLEAAKRLGIKPKRTAIVEDAVSGVKAGSRGKFRLVVGVDRGGNRKSLLKNGADVVVSDLSEISVFALPSALDCFEDLFTRFKKKKLAIFLDYDGTLTPIVDTPDKAVLSKGMKQTVKKLSKYCTVGIISGRDLRDVQRMVGIDSIFYSGSHGFEISGPMLHTENKAGVKFLPQLDIAEDELARLKSIKGVIIERKKFSIAVHYRLAPKGKISFIENVVDKVLKKHPELKKGYGKKVFEVRPNIKWDKGNALLWLLKFLKMETSLPVYIGDDVTDEDAFKAIKKTGIGILVSDDNAPQTLASYTLRDPEEVRKFLVRVISIYK